jgi:hypothetical protein
MQRKISWESSIARGKGGATGRSGVKGCREYMQCEGDAIGVANNLREV